MQSDKEPSKKSIREILHQTALEAPSVSGVYLWRNAENTVIYVGKAKNLKNRLSSYFAGNKDLKTRLLVSAAASIEYITTENEYEAFLLENNMIKKYSPRYNINLKDGKSYPVIRITNEDFPYPDAGALDSFIDTLYQIYPLRHCKVLRQRESPCLYYHIGQCKAPCCSRISKESYNEFFGEITRLLEGKGVETRKKLEEEMKRASKSLNFEKAARIRDGLSALSILQKQNVVEGFDSEDRDYIAYHRDGELVSFTVLKIRESLNEEDELIGEFMNVYYSAKDEVPPSIYVPTQRDYEIVQEWILRTLGSDSRLVVVDNDSEKKHVAAMDMAFHNAKEDILRRLRERSDLPALEELRELLGLKKLPVRIEGFDIAHIGGKFPVASLVSFYNGNPDKKNYRYFRLKTTDGYIDDFQSMREATSRRYTRLLNEQADFPDLILIDGGIGQVNAVKGVLDLLELDIPIIALAEKNEEIWLPDATKAIVLPRRSDALRLLQRIRDETHRFATSRNQRLRTKENIVSVFLELPSVGERRARLLEKRFVTIENLSASTKEDVMSAINVSENAALSIIENAVLLSRIRKEKKESQMRSLGSAGTTAQTASQAQYIDELAEKIQEKFDKT